MNILHIISGGEAGGSKNHLLTLSHNLKFSGFKNIIVCFMEGELYNEAVEKGLDIRLMKQRQRFDLTVVWKLKKLCQEEDIEIVNCHGGRANFIGFFLKMVYEAKYASTIHSDYKEDYLGNSYKTLVFSNINRLVLKRFDNYITVSDSFKNMLIERGYRADKIHVVYNGIDFNKERERFNKIGLLVDYGIMGATHYVTMVARFHPVKGHSIFLEACQKVLESFDDVIFILLGDGETKEEIKRYADELNIKNNVYFAGFKNPDKFLYLSDFTVLASYTESFPLVILESAFYEKTVVTTRVGGIDKLIDDGVNGFLVEVGNSDEMAAKMLELLNDRRKCKEFGKNLYEKAKNEFSINNMINEYISIYKDIDGGIYI
jgi:L-malate glycosyltransferase